MPSINTSMMGTRRKPARYPLLLKPTIHIPLTESPSI